MGLMLVGCWWTELGKRKTENEGPKTVCGLKIRSRSPLLAGWATVITGEGAGMPTRVCFSPVAGQAGWGSGGGCAGWSQPADEGEPGQAHANAELTAHWRLGGVIDRAAALGVRAHIVHPQHVGLDLRVVETETLKHQLEPSS